MERKNTVIKTKIVNVNKININIKDEESGLSIKASYNNKDSLNIKKVELPFLETNFAFNNLRDMFLKLLNKIYNNLNVTYLGSHNLINPRLIADVLSLSLDKYSSNIQKQ